MADQLIWLALFDNAHDTLPIQKAYPWSRVIEMLETHSERDAKDGPLFSPTLYRKNSRRAKQNVQTVTLLVMDFDDGVSPEELTPSWDAHEYFLYSTYSHSPAKPKWRAVFPLR